MLRTVTRPRRPGALTAPARAVARRLHTAGQSGAVIYASLAAGVPEGADFARLDRVTRALSPDPGVAFVSRAQPNDPVRPTAAVWNLVPTSGPQDQATTALLKRFGGEVLTPAEAEAGVDVAVTGTVAAAASSSSRTWSSS